MALHVDAITKDVVGQRSGVMDWDGLGGQYLAAVLSNPLAFLQPVAVEAKIKAAGFKIGLPLAVGGSSIVFEDASDATRVLKVATSGSAQHEFDVLDFLAKNSIPRAVRCIAFEKAQLLLKPRGTRLNDYRGVVPYAIFADVWKCLFRMHAKGVVHRDVRPVNIIVFNDRGYLIDFSAAHWVSLGATAYAGTTRFASDAVLKQLNAAAPHVTVNAADDME
eukprot:TRINITY_DN5096_c0_g1_i2.p2 TRINITY_DN5096_c0_g1~~TRINITY_DN5096_c0_g1_i2.p2  ORF type:complete len:220 (-),score=46.96 TRINITY_DN5096_c0_g1_i2:8-667(-)